MPYLHALFPLDAANRRKVAALYSMTNLVQMEPFVDECSDLLVKRFKEFAQAGRQMDMGHWLQCYAFDVIGHISVAKRFGFLDAGEDIDGVPFKLSEYRGKVVVLDFWGDW